MKALLLAGGFGTRMRPLTLTRPKHLLPIANRAHIDLVLDRLQRHGIEEVVLTTSYLAESFGSTVAGAQARGLRLEVAHEEVALGTGGAIGNAAALLQDGRFLVLNADVLTDADLSQLVRRHAERRAEMTMLLTPVEDPSAFGVAELGDGGRVVRFIEKPPADQAPSNLINAGVYVMEPSVLELIPPGVEHSAERELFPLLVERGSLFAEATDRYWMDVGTPAKYLQANLDALAGRVEASTVVVGGCVLGAGVKVAKGARISSVALGDGCSVASDAVIERSVLLPRATVEQGAVVEDSIIGEGVQVAAGTHVSGEVLPDATVAS